MSAYRQRPRWGGFKYLPQVLILLGLVLLFLVVQWLVRTFQKPGHMGVLESQTMDMSVQPPAGAMPVSIETIEPRPFANAVTYTGTAVAYNDITVFPRVEGWLTSVPVYPGDHVQAGQIVAQLDTRELASRSAEAQANQAATLFQKEKARQAIASANATLAFRQAQIQRSRSLVAEDVITQEEAQKDESDFTTAQAEYRQAQAELKAAQQAASAATFQAGTQRIIQGYSRITAPQKGVVTQRMASPGMLVSPGAPIMQIAQIQPIRIQASVAESDLGDIQPGISVTIWQRKNKGSQPIQAKVSAIFPKADLQTRTAIVEAILPNSDEAFIPGEFVTVSINTSKQKQALTVSNRSIIEQDGQEAVWLMVDGKAHLQFVTTGGSDGERTAIIDGLKAGDTVITRGMDNLTEGVLVAKADYDSQGLKTLPKTANSNRLALQNQYRLKRIVGMYITTIQLQDKAPKIGQNTVSLAVSSGPGMTMPTNNINIEATSLMPSMASMAVPKPEVQKVDDGRFSLKTMFGMPGLWRLTITVKDGNQTLDTFPVDIEVPES